MPSFLDPPPVSDGPLGPIETALETATDAYIAACNANAEAENAYQMAFSVHYVESQVAVTARQKWCDARPDVVDAKCAWNLARAHERACNAKCEELKSRLMAAMSWQRTVGAQT